MLGRSFDRRAFLNACTRAGIASPLLPGILYTLAAQAQETGSGANPAAKSPDLPKITPEMLDQAAALAGSGPFTLEQKKMMLDGLNGQRAGYDKIARSRSRTPFPQRTCFIQGPRRGPQRAA